MKLSRYILPCLLMTAGLALRAQNIDPTVSVTRTYDGKLMEIPKPAVQMEIPDSVLKFNLDFDYSVKDSPFKGSYEFIPYLQDIAPASDDGKAKQLWLRLGAGYGLHPEFDFVWSPRFKGAYKMNLYASHRSYFGKYHSVKYDGGVLDRSGDFYKGWDASTRAGLDGRYDWDGGLFTYDASYRGLNTNDGLRKMNSNGLDVSARVRSEKIDESYLLYDVSMAYRFDSHKIDASSLGTHSFSLDAQLGGVFSFDHAILLDLNLDVASYNGLFSSQAGKIGLVPQYLYNDGRWNLKLGLAVEMLLRPKAIPDGFSGAMNAFKGQVVYPDVKVSYAAIPSHLNVYFKATGGADINSYQSVSGKNHWYGPSWWGGECSPAYNSGALADNTIERVNVSAGIEGNIVHRLSYDLYGGFAAYGNALFDGVMLYDKSASALSLPLPVASYSKCNTAYVGMKADFTADMIDTHLDMTYRWTSLYKNKVQAFEPSRFTGDVWARYNWKHKFYAQVGCEWALARRGFAAGAGDPVGISDPEAVLIPGWADLSLCAAWAATSYLHIWAKGGNLAAMTIQRTPLYAEKGAYFALGITLNI